MRGENGKRVNLWYCRSVCNWSQRVRTTNEGTGPGQDKKWLGGEKLDPISPFSLTPLCSVLVGHGKMAKLIVHERDDIPVV